MNELLFTGENLGELTEFIGGCYKVFYGDIPSGGYLFKDKTDKYGDNQLVASAGDIIVKNEQGQFSIKKPTFPILKFAMIDNGEWRCAADRGKFYMIHAAEAKDSDKVVFYWCLALDPSNVRGTAMTNGSAVFECSRWESHRQIKKAIQKAIRVLQQNNYSCKKMLELMTEKPEFLVVYLKEGYVEAFKHTTKKNLTRFVKDEIITRDRKLEVT